MESILNFGDRNYRWAKFIIYYFKINSLYFRIVKDFYESLVLSDESEHSDDSDDDNDIESFL